MSIGEESDFGALFEDIFQDGGDFTATVNNGFNGSIGFLDDLLNANDMPQNSGKIDDLHVPVALQEKPHNLFGNSKYQHVTLNVTTQHQGQRSQGICENCTPIAHSDSSQLKTIPLHKYCDFSSVQRLHQEQVRQEATKVKAILMDSPEILDTMIDILDEKIRKQREMQFSAVNVGGFPNSNVDLSSYLESPGLTSTNLNDDESHNLDDRSFDDTFRYVIDIYLILY